MKLLLNILPILFIASGFIRSTEVNIITKEKEIIIRIENFKPDLQPSADKGIAARINHNDFAFPASNSKYQIDEFRFFIALPDDNLPELQTFRYGEQTSTGVMFKDAYNKKFDESQRLSFSAGIEYIGTLRGIHLGLITFQPFNYENSLKTLNWSETMSLHIKFYRELPLREFKEVPFDIFFLSHLINKEHLPYLYELSNNLTNYKKTDYPQAFKKWYSTDKEYLKLTTTKDGIAAIKGTEIIKANSFFDGKKSDFIHLIFRGSDYPCYFRNEADSVFDSQTEIIFLGKRPSGDTTWFDNYTKEAAFYLVYDENYPASRLRESANIPGNAKEVKSAGVDRHIEYETVYEYGFPQDNSEIVPGEGWMWALLSPQPNMFSSEKFETDFIYNPSDDPSDTISTEVHFASGKYDPFSKFGYHHRLQFSLNTDTIALNNYKGPVRTSFSIKQSTADFIGGVNHIGVKSIGVIYQGNYILPDEIGIDFIRVKGTEKPFAEIGYCEFTTDTLTEDSFIKIGGYSSNNVIAIDNKNEQIQFTKTTEGFTVKAGAKSEGNPYISMLLNNLNVISGNSRGINTGILFPPDYSRSETKYFQDFNIAFRDYLASLPDGVLIALVNNSGSIPSADIANLLTTMGSKEIRNLSAEDVWIFTTIKNNTESTFEKRSKASAGFAHFIPYTNGSTYCAEINLPAGFSYHFTANDQASIETPSVFPVKHSDLTDASNFSGDIIISHERFLEAADSLRAYRQKTNPELNPVVIDVENIYKEFYYGKKSPHAIKEFLKYAAKNWKKPAPAYLTLFGDASYDCRKILSTSKNEDYIPTFGWPATDYWYVQLSDTSLLPQMVVGRIPVMNLQQGFDYIDKLKLYDTIPNNPWMKRFVYLTGGLTKLERENFYDIVKGGIVDYIIMSPPNEICADTNIIRKRDESVGGEAEATEIISSINKGTFWTVFAGHGSPLVLDMDGWQVDKLNNKGKYGFFSTISCNTSDFADPQITCRNEDYVMYPGKGFIGAGGSSNFSMKDVAFSLHINMIKLFANKLLNLTRYSEILTKAKSMMLKSEAEIYISQQYTYLGDPLAEHKITHNTDLYFLDSDIKIKNKESSDIITEEDSSAIISGFIYDLGFKENNPVDLILIREWEQLKDTIRFSAKNGICYGVPFALNLNVYKKPGTHRLKLIIDPEQKLKELKRSNNTYSTVLNVYTQGLYPVEPLAFWNISYDKPEFRFINPIGDPMNYIYNLKIFKSADSSKILIYSSNDNEIEINEAFIDWIPGIQLENNKNYFLEASTVRKSDSKVSPLLTIPFHTKIQIVTNNTSWVQSSKAQLLNGRLNNLTLNQSGDSVKVFLSSIQIPYQILSVRGNNVSAKRAVEIKFDNLIYVTASPFLRGFNVVVLHDSDLSFKNYKRFDTWSDSTDKTKDSVSVRLVSFLRDSVSNDDLVLFALCDESFQVFEFHTPPSSGSLDTLKSVLKTFGSKYADSLAWGSSYALIGKRGASPGEYPEGWSGTGDTILLEGSIEKQLTRGNYTSDLIGPATKWNKIKISGDYHNSSSELQATIFGRQKFNYTQDELIRQEITGDSVLLNSISADKYPYIKLQLDLSKSNKSDNPYFSSIQCEFEPSPEYAVLKSKSFAEPNQVLRGENLDLNFAVQNISKRKGSQKNTLVSKIFSSQGQVDQFLTQFGTLAESQFTGLRQTISTDNYEEAYSVTGSVNEDQTENELYTFNNKTTIDFLITDDKEKPRAVLKLDGTEINDGDYTSENPDVAVELHDNSSLPVTDQKKIEVFINARWKNPDKYIFTSYGKNRTLKAVAMFKPDSLLEQGDNIFKIHVSDASGNRDTLTRRVKVTNNTEILNAQVIPNPVLNIAYFEFYYKSPDSKGETEIIIYNLNGQKVRTINWLLCLRKNRVEWDVRDDYGNAVPPGIYFYRLAVRSDLYSDPVTGKFILVR